MARGLFFLQYKWFMVVIMTIIMVGLSGCSPQPLTATPQIVCTPDAPNANIYRSASRTTANMIVQSAYPSLPTPVSPEIATPMPLLISIGPESLGARYAAFQYLKDQVTRWSDTETIKLDDLNIIEVIVTFISPDLVQAVFLNDFLKNGILTSDFDVQLQTVLNSIAERDELLFLVTVTSTNNNNSNSIPHVIDIPISEMKLNNAGNLESIPGHDDHNLDQPINSSFDPVFGYVAYPLGVLNSNGCNWTLDPKYNTNIVITVPDIKINDATSRPYTWTIPYKSLINANIPPDPLMFIPAPGFNPDLVFPLTKPPYPLSQPMVANGSNPDLYWQDFARFIWNQVTLRNYK